VNNLNKQIQQVTERIRERSQKSRSAYLTICEENFGYAPKRAHLSCGNLAHAFAGCGATDKELLAEGLVPNLGIITAYNDMLSAHKTYETYPEKIREFANEFKGTAQVAGATPAMCDGVTQGQPGMDLSLLSRDIIALAAGIGLSHDMFDGAISLGICDKIVPGLLIGNLSFGHLPTIFMPGGPMHSGISNDEKAKIRQDFAEGKIDRNALLKGESDSYHSPGTCTFYGTANSNQMLMEIMGMQLPGSSFVNPDTAMRTGLNREAVQTLINNVKIKDINRSVGYIIDEKAIVNGVIGLLATGGSTNHTLHLIAIAKAAGIKLTWQDFSDLASVIPLITRIYPNGPADVNHFHAAGGMAFVIYTLLENGLLHEDVNTILGKGLRNYTKDPKLDEKNINYVDGPVQSLNEKIIRSAQSPFDKTGGLKVLIGNIGTAIIKTSAVDPSHHTVEAQAIVFDDQDDLIKQFKADALNRDFIAVLPFQGPKYKGMPELHKLTPTLTILQKRGYKVGLITDGRMSGASGKIPAAIHVSPEACEGGLIGKIETGDLLKLNADEGTLECLDQEVSNRAIRKLDYQNNSHGRSLFNNLRNIVGSSEEGAGIL